MMKNYSKKQLVPKWNKFKLKATVKWISIMQSKNTRDFSREMNQMKLAQLQKSATQLKRNDPRTRKDRISNVEINYYNLDVIISVGYRVKSRNGITFINVQP